MATRKSFLLRLDHETYESLARWASDDLRSVNGQVEFLLRRSLLEAGRLGGAATSRGRRGDGAGEGSRKVSPSEP